MTWCRLSFFCCLSALTPTLFAAVEFHKDVEPLLQAHCQTCHRPGEIGPMPLLTYANVRPWAKSIQNAVVTGKMPPWFADNTVQHYRNDPSLSAAEIKTISDWVDSGAPEGDPKLAPAPRTFVDGWNIGKPDMVIQMPAAYQIPARGTIEYTYIIIPTNFKEDVWVQSLEIRPEDRAHMHHVVLYARQPGSKWLREYPVGEPFVPVARPGTRQRSSDGDRLSEGSMADEWLVSYVPGLQPYTLPKDTAFRIRAGSEFVLQLHYTTNGTPSSDRTRIGMVISKTPPAKRAFIANVGDSGFTIPPGDANYSAKGEATLASDVVMLGASPHMHVRGKAMDLQATYPTGETEMLFHVPKYDFNWQLNYYLQSPKLLPKGTKLEAVATWDNSVNNRYNPDPKAEVRWGDQTWEEMLLAITTIQIEPDADLDKIFTKPPRRDPPPPRE